jgi:hypothetical protein
MRSDRFPDMQPIASDDCRACDILITRRHRCEWVQPRVRAGRYVFGCSSQAGLCERREPRKVELSASLSKVH